MSHQALSLKASCQQCWRASQELHVDYLELVRQHHHAELVHMFSQDRFLDQQRAAQQPGPRHHHRHMAA